GMTLSTGGVLSGTPTTSNTYNFTITATDSIGRSGSMNFGLTISSTGAWYNTSWPYRKAITIDHTKVSGSSSLSSFPLLVSVTDANLKTVANGGGVGKSDGTDILFTSSDGTTKLDHEIESYNASTGQFIGWVRIPALSPTADTVIYAYYG